MLVTAKSGVRHSDRTACLLPARTTSTKQLTTVSGSRRRQTSRQPFTEGQRITPLRAAARMPNASTSDRARVQPRARVGDKLMNGSAETVADS